ncbi:MAG: class I SAM-dependent methyltransferase [Steroidobacteraceae bacterium]
MRSTPPQAGGCASSRSIRRSWSRPEATRDLRGSEFKDHFSGVAAQYAAFRPRYPAELFDFLGDRCESRRLAWDCACGTGQASVDLAERFDRVVATDASARQIEAAFPHERVEYRVASAEHSGLADGSIDLVTVAQALHWFDLPRFYAEVRRVLAPRGVIAVWTYGGLTVADAAIDELLRHFASGTVGPYWPPERRLVDAGYRTLPFPFAEIDAPQFLMQCAWPLPHLVGYLRSWSATQRFIAQLGIDPTADLAQRLSPLWGDSSRARAITWPLQLRLGFKAGRASPSSSPLSS